MSKEVEVYSPCCSAQINWLQCDYCNDKEKEPHEFAICSLCGEDVNEVLVPALSTKMDYDQWLLIGQKNNWVGPAVCYTHDGLPTSEAEDNEFSEGDPCIHILRLYESKEIKDAVEDNHAPSVWRKTNQ